MIIKTRGKVGMKPPPLRESARKKGRAHLAIGPTPTALAPTVCEGCLNGRINQPQWVSTMAECQIPVF
jgi:hypothetical protein